MSHLFPHLLHQHHQNPPNCVESAKSLASKLYHIHIISSISYEWHADAWRQFLLSVYFLSLSWLNSTRRCQSILHVEHFSSLLLPLSTRITSSTIPPITNEFGTEGKKICLHDIYTIVVEKINLRAVVSHDISPGNHLIVTITSLGAEAIPYESWLLKVSQRE